MMKYKLCVNHFIKANINKMLPKARILMGKRNYPFHKCYKKNKNKNGKKKLKRKGILKKNILNSIHLG